MEKYTSLEDFISKSKSMSEIRSLEPNDNPCQSAALNNVDTNTEGRDSVNKLPTNESPPSSSQGAPEVILGKLESVECIGRSKKIPQVKKNTAPVSDKSPENNKDLEESKLFILHKIKEFEKSNISPVGEEGTSSKASNVSNIETHQPQEISTKEYVSQENVTDIELLDIGKNSTEDSTNILSDSTEDPTNILSDEEKEKLMLYLCYHSFELLDFRDDSVWQNLMKKKDFKNNSWKVYKKQFLDNLVDNIDVYHIPFYFSKHMKKTYGNNSKSSFSSEELGKKCSKTKNDPASCQPTRKNTVDLYIFSSDEDKVSRTYKKQKQKYGNIKDNMNKSSTSTSKSRKSRNSLPTSSYNSTDKTQTQKGNISDSKSSEKENSKDMDCSNNGANNPTKKEMKTLETKYSFLQKCNITPNNSTYKSNVPEEMMCKVILSNTELNSSDTDTSFSQINTSQVQLKRKQRSGLKRAKEPECSDEESSDTKVESYQQMKKWPSKAKPLFEFFNTSTPPSRTKEKLPQPHKTPRTPRPLFMNYEKRKMLKYMEECNSYQLNTIKGNVFWQDMEASGIMKGRTWHSLRNHFFKTMIFELRRFKLKPEFESKLKELVGPKR